MIRPILKKKLASKCYSIPCAHLSHLSLDLFQAAVRLYPIYNTLKQESLQESLPIYQSFIHTIDCHGIWLQLRNFPDHLWTAAGSRWNRRLPVSCRVDCHQVAQENVSRRRLNSRIKASGLHSTYFGGMTEISQMFHRTVQTISFME